MTTWMVVGEISHHFGFVVVESEAGLVLLVFTTAIAVMLHAKKILPLGFKVFTASLLLNWWGHAILLPQIYLANAYQAPIFLTTYKLTGILSLVAFAGLMIQIYRKPAGKPQLIYYGLWLYALLVTGVEGVLDMANKTFGH